MNGALNEEGTKPKNLPFINSSGGFAIGNSSNVTIRNVTFEDSYQGHAIQIAGSKMYWWINPVSRSSIT